MGAEDCERAPEGELTDLPPFVRAAAAPPEQCAALGKPRKTAKGSGQVCQLRRSHDGEHEDPHGARWKTQPERYVAPIDERAELRELVAQDQQRLFTEALAKLPPVHNPAPAVRRVETTRQAGEYRLPIEED